MTREPKVFISYSHDSPAHMDRVKALARRLRQEGIQCVIDQDQDSPPEGIARWCTRQIEQAELVLVVCTPKYLTRFNAEEQPGRGQGVTWEGSIINQELYNAQGHNEKFIPVIFSAAARRCIPLVLQGAIRYQIPVDNVGLYRRLKRVLHVPPGREKSDVHFLIAPTSSNQHASYQMRLESALRKDHGLKKASTFELSGNLRRYGTSYCRAFEKFLHDKKSGNWLLTIQPERPAWKYTPAQEEQIAVRLAESDKRILFFDSGWSLDDARKRLIKKREWKTKWPNPFTIIQTPASAALDYMVQHMITSKLFDGLKEDAPVVIIVIPGPNTHSARERRRYYHAFLSAIHFAQSLPADARRKHLNALHWPDLCGLLSKARLRTATTPLFRHWDSRLARNATRSLLQMCDFRNAECKTLFLCGNDQLALGALEAVQSVRGGQNAIAKKQVAFFGIDGHEEMTRALHRKTIAGFTLLTDFEGMCRTAVEAIEERNAGIISRQVIREVSPIPWNAGGRA